MARKLYVIALDKEVLKEAGFVKYNPQYEEGKNCYYVGESGYSAEKRFEIINNLVSGIGMLLNSKKVNVLEGLGDNQR